MVTPSGVFFIRFHADRLVIRLKPMDGKMTVPQQHALFPNALSDVLGTLNTQKRSIVSGHLGNISHPWGLSLLPIQKRKPDEKVNDRCLVYCFSHSSNGANQHEAGKTMPGPLPSIHQIRRLIPPHPLLARIALPKAKPNRESRARASRVYPI